MIKTCNPAQSVWELNQLLSELTFFPAPRVLEIGVHRGGSLRLWREFFRPRVLIGVNEINEVEGETEDMQLVIGRSQDLAVRAHVEALLDGWPVDFVFIDGGHYLEEITADYAWCNDLVRAGGIIALHDVHAESTGVPEVWRQISALECTKTIWSPLDGGTGTGIVYVGQVTAEEPVLEEETE